MDDRWDMGYGFWIRTMVEAVSSLGSGILVGYVRCSCYVWRAIC